MIRGSTSFDQDSRTQNSIKFKIDDIVGNTGEGGECTVRVDAGVDALIKKAPSGQN